MVPSRTSAEMNRNSRMTAGMKLPCGMRIRAVSTVRIVPVMVTMSGVTFMRSSPRAIGSTTGAMTPRASALFSIRRPIVARNPTPSAQDEGPCCEACALGDCRPATKGTSWHRRTPQGVGRSLHRPAPPTSATWSWSDRPARARRRSLEAMLAATGTIPRRAGRPTARRSRTSTRPSCASSAPWASRWRPWSSRGQGQLPRHPRVRRLRRRPARRAARRRRRLFVVSAVDGVDGATQMLWEECAAVGMPRAVVVTSSTSERADFDELVAICQRVFGEGVLPAVPADDGRRRHARRLHRPAHRADPRLLQRHAGGPRARAHAPRR